MILTWLSFFLESFDTFFNLGLAIPPFKRVKSSFLYSYKYIRVKLLIRRCTRPLPSEFFVLHLSWIYEIHFLFILNFSLLFESSPPLVTLIYTVFKLQELYVFKNLRLILMYPVLSPVSRFITPNESKYTTRVSDQRVFLNVYWFFDTFLINY